MTGLIGSAGENSFDPIIPLAFAVQGNPGAYALLLGAGISASSGIPTSWDVENSLILAIARIHNETPDDPTRWYAEKYGNPARYDELLSHLTASQTERQKLLKDFFVPVNEDGELEPFRPTPAHRAIAQLVLSKRIRIILTTNFDQLVETALRDIGIEPIIIREASQLTGIAPLHAQECIVIHLHGDYLTPVGLLNTTEELTSYPPETNELLDKVLAEYGLVIVGWSGRWDVALRSALGRTSSKHYGRYWIDENELIGEGKDLQIQMKSVLIKSTADNALSQLQDACGSIAQNKPRGPLTVNVAVASAKKALAKQGTAISLHDSIAAELKYLRSCEVIANPIYQAANEQEEYKRRVEILETAMAVPVSLIATTVFWGGPQTDSWWFGEMARFATKRPVSGLTSFIDLLRLPATTLFYASGIAAAGSNRYELLRRLMVEPVTEDNNGKSVAVSRLLTPNVVLYFPHAGKHLYEYLNAVFVDQMGFTIESFRESWQKVEYLSLVQAVFSQLQEEHALEPLLENRRKISEYLGRESAEKDAATKTQLVLERKSFEIEREQLLRSHISKLPRYTPHLVVEGFSENYIIEIGRILRRELDRDGQSSSMVLGGLCDGNLDAMISSLEIVDLALRNHVTRVSGAGFFGGGSLVQTPFWLDDPRNSRDLQ